MYLLLYSDDSLRYRDDDANEGFRAVPVFWRKHLARGRSGVHIDCSCEVALVYGVQDTDKAKLFLKHLLDDNPGVSADRLGAEIGSHLDELIQNRLDEWVTGDPYYEPDMDDFPGECRWVKEDFFEKHGLKLVRYDCDTTHLISKRILRLAGNFAAERALREIFRLRIPGYGL